MDLSSRRTISPKALVTISGTDDFFRYSKRHHRYKQISIFSLALRIIFLNPVVSTVNHGGMFSVSGPRKELVYVVRTDGIFETQLPPEAEDVHHTDTM